MIPVVFALIPAIVGAGAPHMKVIDVNTHDLFGSYADWPKWQRSKGCFAIWRVSW